MRILYPLGLALLLLLVPAARAADEPPADSPELIIQTPHSGDVNAVAFSPDGKVVATASADGTLKLWHTESGQELRTLTGHVQPVQALAFSHDGKTLASGASNATVKLWEVSTGKELRIHRPADGPILSLAFGPQDKTVIAGCAMQVHIFKPDAEKGEETMRLDLPGVGALVLFPLGRRTVAACAADKAVRLVNADEGTLFPRPLAGHDGRVTALAFGRQGQLLASGSEDKTIRLWKPPAPRSLLTLQGHTGTVTALAFSADGKYLVSGSEDRSVRIWDPDSGKQLGLLKTGGREVRALAHHPSKPLLITAVKGAPAQLWAIDTARYTARSLGELTGPLDKVYSIGVSPDGKHVLVGTGRSTTLWHPGAADQLQVLREHAEHAEIVALRPDGRLLAGSGGKKADAIRFFGALGGGKALGAIAKAHRGDITALIFSPDGRHLAGADAESHIHLWRAPDVRMPGEKRGKTESGKPAGGKPVGGKPGGGKPAEGKPVHQLETHGDEILALAFSPDGNSLAAATYDKSGNGQAYVRVWDRVSGREVHTIKVQVPRVYCLAFSPDGKLLATGGERGGVRVWEVATGKMLRSFSGPQRAVYALAFVPDAESTVLASGGVDGLVHLWDAATGKGLGLARRHGRSVRALAFADKGRLLFSASGDGLDGEAGDGTIKIWRRTERRLEPRELCTLVSFANGSWAVVEPGGRYDASNGGDVDWLHWNVKNEPIALSQLKERYYEPGLLAKLLGINTEPLRPVAALDNLKLPPGVEVKAVNAKRKTLTLHLTNQGGDLGRVQVFVNDKEVTADARKGINPRAKEADVTLDLSAVPTFRGRGDKVRVVAWNADNSLSGRGLVRELDPGDGPAAPSKPELYAIIAGVSTYEESRLNLKYPAKDAEDVAAALKLGAERLFGADRVHITLLTSSPDGKSGQRPTKENFEKAFAAARRAKPDDVFLVYLAGHGVALPDSDIYCYLTADATSLETKAYADPKERKKTTVSSEELVEWIKQVPALKQVMVLDTCAAGAAADKLMERRDVPASQARAIERLKDRTGFHVLMGCAADRVSYEATLYRQGLLTYAVLEGIRGPALDTKELLDVTLLFRHAARRVPELAQDIGGIQQPLVSSPRAQPFGVGQFTADDLRRLAVTTPRPVLLRPLLSNPDAGDDTLRLMPLVQKELDQRCAAAAKAKQPGPTFLDVAEMPNGIRPAGTYSVNGQKVTVKVKLRQDGEELASLPAVEGTRSDLADLAARLAAAIVEAAGKQEAPKDQ